jgi:hypothetical protein
MRISANYIDLNSSSAFMDRKDNGYTQVANFYSQDSYTPIKLPKFGMAQVFDPKAPFGSLSPSDSCFTETELNRNNSIVAAFLDFLEKNTSSIERLYTPEVKKVTNKEGFKEIAIISAFAVAGIPITVEKRISEIGKTFSYTLILGPKGKQQRLSLLFSPSVTGKPTPIIKITDEERGPSVIYSTGKQNIAAIEFRMDSLRLKQCKELHQRLAERFERYLLEELDPKLHELTDEDLLQLLESETKK